jgi:hypothetical protein
VEKAIAATAIFSHSGQMPRKNTSDIVRGDLSLLWRDIRWVEIA